jgi:hypothetical protein
MAAEDKLREEAARRMERRRKEGQLDFYFTLLAVVLSFLNL